MRWVWTDQSRVRCFQPNPNSYMGTGVLRFGCEISPQVCVFEHWVPSYWHCSGMMWSFKQVECVEERTD